MESQNAISTYLNVTICSLCAVEFCNEMIRCGAVPQCDDALNTFYSDGKRIHRVEFWQLVLDEVKNSLDKRRNANKVFHGTVRAGTCEFASFVEIITLLVHLRYDIVVGGRPVVKKPFKSLQGDLYAARKWTERRFR